MSLSLQNTRIAFQSRNDAELRTSYWLFRLMNHPWLVKLGIHLVSLALKLGLPIEPLIRRTFFRQFCGGETIEESLRVVERLAHYGVGAILDYAAEASQQEQAFETNASEILKTIDLASKDRRVPFCVFKVTAIARFSLLERLGRGEELAPQEQSEWERAKRRVENLCHQAHAGRVRLFFDAEETWIQDVIDILAEQHMERFNREQPIIYNTLQMYRTDRMAYLKRSLHSAGEKQYYLGLKLVRGAYMEKERERAQVLNYPSPIFGDKASTDQAFDSALTHCVHHLDRVALCAGTHNEASTVLLTQLMADTGIANSDERIWFAQLLGMSDNLTFNLAAQGYRVAKYVPFGPVRLVVPYLFRRAQENTSVTGQMSRELMLLAQERGRRQKQ